MVVAQFMSYREMVWRLRQFEPHRYLLQVLATWLIVLGLMTTPIVAIGLNAYAGTVATWPLIAASAVLVAATTGLASWQWPKKPWRRPVAERLWTYECTDNLPWAVRALVRPGDAERAATALRRAKFNPHSFLQVGSPPPDALDLAIQIQVVRPAAWHSEATDEQQLQDVIAVFRDADIRARIGGFDVISAIESLVPSAESGHDENEHRVISRLSALFDRFFGLSAKRGAE